MPAHFVKIARDGSQRLVIAERHIPSLAGEDREDGRTFSAELAAGKEPQEKDDREGKKAEDRYGLEDIEGWHDNEFGLSTLRGECADHEGEQQRYQDRGEHAQGGP